MLLQQCIHLQTKPLDPLHDTLCKVIHCCVRWCLQEHHVQGKGLSYRGNVLDLTFLGERLDCRPVDPAGSSESSENGVTSVGMFTAHLRGDAGWWPEPEGGAGGEAAQDPELCVDFHKQYLPQMKNPADPGEKYAQSWESECRQACLHLLCSLPSLHAVWTSNNKCHLLRICFSLGMHGQQNSQRT